MRKGGWTGYLKREQNASCLGVVSFSSSDQPCSNYTSGHLFWMVEECHDCQKERSSNNSSLCRAVILRPSLPAVGHVMECKSCGLLYHYTSSFTSAFCASLGLIKPRTLEGPSTGKRCIAAVALPLIHEKRQYENLTTIFSDRRLPLVWPSQYRGILACSKWELAYRSHRSSGRLRVLLLGKWRVGAAKGGRNCALQARS